ncbi:MAG TPA: class A beta-lactamase [Pyrinomonadaceae bacterium]|nr:class A beta-lactamase [Pyrinomonadaceae bacterium]
MTKFLINMFSPAVFGFLLCACANSAPPDTSSSANPVANAASPHESAMRCAPESLQKKFEEIARVTQGPVGAAAMLVETGEIVAMNGKQQFPMQSVYKLPIAMAALEQVDKGILKLDQKIRVEPADLVPQGLRSPLRDKHPRGVELSVRDLLQYMMVDSDGSACDVLLKLMGGPEKVTKYLRDLGVDGIVVATSEKEMSTGDDVQYRNWSTPESMVILLKMLSDGRGISSVNREMLLDFMIRTPTFPGRLKGQLPAGTVVAHKTGSSGTRNGLTRATNDVGLITLPDGRHLAVAVFVSDTKVDAAIRDGVIAKVARASWDCWSVR